jgi:hypothetical protein
MRQDRTRALYAYWDSLRGERLAPERGEVEPGELAELLRDMFILAPDASGEWCLRLAGTRICAFFGRELKGEAFTGLWHAGDRPDVARMVTGCAAEQSPTVAGVDGLTHDGEAVTFELLTLPLRHQGRNNLRMIGGLFPFSRSPLTLRAPLTSLSLVSFRSISGNPQEQRRGLIRTPVLPPDVPRRRHGHLTILDGGRDTQ